MEPTIKYPFVVCHDGVRPIEQCPVFDGKIVYEVIRIIDGKPLFFKEHMNRLTASIALIGREMPDVDAIVAGLKTLIEVNNLKSDNVRVELSCEDASEIIWSVQPVIGVYPPANMYTSGVNVSIIDAQRNDPHAKVVNKALVNQVAEIRQEKGVFEVLLRDTRGYITEGSRSNYFIISKGTLVGVPEALILKGITRDKIIESAKRAGIPYDEALLKDDDLYHADAVLLSGTSIDLLPIAKVDEFQLDSASQPVFNQLLAHYRELMKESLNSF